jgi:hypothetical protein
MVDHKARARLRTWLTQLLDGDIAADDFAEACEEFLDSEDRGVIAIAVFFGTFEDDLSPWHTLKNFDAKTRAYAERCRRLLESDVEYRWPPYPNASRWWLVTAAFLAGSYGLMATALGITLCILAVSLLNARFIAVTSAIAASGVAALWFGFYLGRRDRERKEQEFWRHGDRNAWPFLTRTEYQAADTISA